MGDGMSVKEIAAIVKGAHDIGFGEIPDVGIKEMQSRGTLDGMDPDEWLDAMTMD